jgi:flagellar biosynthesis anti-sigma factor FlgM
MVHPIRPQDIANVYRQQAASTGRAARPGLDAVTGGGGQQAAPRTDRINISDEAVQLRKVLESIGDEPELREQRVAQLRDQIASGTYDRGFTEIATRLVEEGFAQ